MNEYLNIYCEKYGIEIKEENLSKFPMHIYLNQSTGG